MDLTSNGEAGTDSASSEVQREKGTVLYIGLTSGSTLTALTQQPAERDLDLMVVHESNGDRLEVRRDYITYVRATEVDMPTEEEIEAYKVKVWGQKQETNTVNISNSHTGAIITEEVKAAMRQKLSGGYL